MAPEEIIERQVTFHVLPGREAEFETFFQQQYRPAMAKTSGFIKADLLRDAENHTDLMMVLRFDSVDSAAAWRASPEHEALKPHLKSLYSGSELKVYQVRA
jgi:antibiotic biosynthesis monooxygenase (ABM) superfamily enzyme